MKSILNFKTNLTLFAILCHFSFSVFAQEINEGTQQGESSEASCSDYLGKIVCGNNKNIYRVTRDGNLFILTLEFKSTRISNPYICKENQLIRDTEEPNFKEMISFLDKSEREKTLKNPGSYQLKKKGEITYESYDPYKKTIVKMNCSHSK